VQNLNNANSNLWGSLVGATLCYRASSSLCCRWLQCLHPCQLACPMTWCRIPEELNPHQHHSQNLIYVMKFMDFHKWKHAAVWLRNTDTCVNDCWLSVMHSSCICCVCVWFSILGKEVGRVRIVIGVGHIHDCVISYLFQDIKLLYRDACHFLPWRHWLRTEGVCASLQIN
jgi:hypothetical protein